ncbi:alpha/beta hydrolase [Aliikangiella coralliicola]|uniref:Alpha/beta fold hydrolase n=1 Tax=Aliikangiella coralliicola TaxID=2592383 RepID=A0A545UK12_9GAMM|nr:alpha/beta fold hydrolase [Aliikangiella coralliicola]TQV89801.1 alpha/beta fold hydrolase [Aliikangiella coralliicola]
MQINSQDVQISGPAGKIQAILDLPKGSSLTGGASGDSSVSDCDASFISVNCHPHSLHGGTMTNKVVHTVSRSIAGLGIPSLRFNFRGVGASEGSYDEGRGEQLDLLAVVDWMKSRYPGKQLIVTGFSFGSFVSALAASQLQPSMLLSVAPPVQRFDFGDFVRPECDWTIIIGSKDELVEYSGVVEWVNSFSDRPQMITMDDASHFFHGRLIELREKVENIVTQHINNQANEKD